MAGASGGGYGASSGYGGDCQPLADLRVWGYPAFGPWPSSPTLGSHAPLGPWQRPGGIPTNAGAAALGLANPQPPPPQRRDHSETGAAAASAASASEASLPSEVAEAIAVVCARRCLQEMAAGSRGGATHKAVSPLEISEAARDFERRPSVCSGVGIAPAFGPAAADAARFDDIDMGALLDEAMVAYFIDGKLI